MIGTGSLVFWPNKKLLVPCAKVTVFDEELDTLTKELFTLLRRIDGSGLTANQVGISKQVMVCFLGEDKKETVLINPVVENETETRFVESIESCVSLPSIKCKVKNERYTKIRVEALDIEGSPFVLTLQGKDAVIVQHGMDHIRGETVLKYLSPLSRRLKKKRMQTFAKKHFMERLH